MTTTVLLITHSLATGGTDRVAVFLANGFARRFKTALLSVRRPADGADLPAMIDDAVEAISLDKLTSGRTLDLLAGIPGLIRQVRRLRPDWIVATGNNNSLFAMLGHWCNPNRQGRLAVKITNPIMRRRDPPLRRWFRRRLYGLVLGSCDRILALSAGEAEWIEGLYPALRDRVRVVQNPYVTEAMLAIGDRRASRSSTRRFLAVGRLHHQKNFALLVDAWAMANLPEARLEIAGDGPLAGTLEQQIADLGLGPTVTLLGYRSDVGALLERADCLVLSSDYEGLPAVVLEAFASGCPVISTACFPAAPDLVGIAPGCALVPIRDAPALARAIRASTEREAEPGEALQNLARPYRMDDAIESHAHALTETLRSIDR